MKLKSGADLHTNHKQNAFNELREQADRERRNRRADPAVQDGKYGFGAQGDLLGATKQSSSGLYSDEMMVDAPSQKNQNRRRRQQR